MFLLLDIKDGDVVIPDFLGRLGLLTSCVLCPAAKVYYCCRVLLARGMRLSKVVFVLEFGVVF